MNDFLQTLANVTQVVSLVWTIFLGGKSVFEIRKLRLQNRPIRSVSFWSFMINLLSFFIILVLLIVNFILVNYLGTVENALRGEVSSSATFSGKSVPSTPSVGSASSTAGSSLTPSVGSASSTASSLLTPSVGGTPLVSGPLLTPPATASSGGRNINKQLTCSASACDGNIEIILLFSKVDVSKQITVLTFSIANIRGNQTYSVYSSNSSVNLQSALDSKPYEGYQQDSGSGFSFYLGPGQRVQQNIQFNFIPYKDIEYKLLIDFQPSSMDTITFDPVTVVF